MCVCVGVCLLTCINLYTHICTYTHTPRNPLDCGQEQSSTGTNGRANAKRLRGTCSSGNRRANKIKSKILNWILMRERDSSREWKRERGRERAGESSQADNNRGCQTNKTVQGAVAAGEAARPHTHADSDTHTHVTQRFNQTHTHRHSST